MKVFLVVILAALLALPAAVSTAAAQTTPGGSEFDQYVPEVPEAEEDVPLKDKQGKKDNRGASDGGGSAGGGAAITPQTSGVQDQTTTDDDAAASRRDGDGNGTRDSASSDRDQFRVGGTSSAGAVADTLSGESDGGIGIGLPLLLAATVAAGIGYVLVRRRVISRKRSAGPGGG
jgi:hypothetical protein